MRRSIAILLTAVLVVLGSIALAGTVSAAKMAKTTTCSNGVDDTPGLGLICQVTVVNTITPTGGSARVTVRECHGAAGNPKAACTTKTTRLNTLVSWVRQCNASTNGGGGTLRCSVRVTNNFIGLKAGATAATINECVGSGDGIANTCDPFPASTTGATITQCNGSANGGTLVQLKCTASGTKSSVHGVRINQCNGSTNGGGALVICSASIVNNTVAASPGGTGSGPGTTLPPTATPAVTDVPGSGPPAIVFFGIFLIAFSVVVSRRLERSIRSR